LTSVGDQKVRADVATIFSGENSTFHSLSSSSASRNGCHTACAPLRSRPWNTIETLSTLSGRKRICSPQCGFEQAGAAEVERHADEAAKGGRRRRLHRQVDGAEILGQRMHAQG
jgi:hypothetical protein